MAFEILLIADVVPSASRVRTAYHHVPHRPEMVRVRTLPGFPRFGAVHVGHILCPTYRAVPDLPGSFFH